MKIRIASIEKLFQYSDGLIILIGGSRSLISSLILSGNSLEVSFLLKKIENIFKDNAYIEIQRHNEEHEKNLELKLLRIKSKIYNTFNCYSRSVLSNSRYA